MSISRFRKLKTRKRKSNATNPVGQAIDAFASGIAFLVWDVFIVGFSEGVASLIIRFMARKPRKHITRRKHKIKGSVTFYKPKKF